MSGLAWLIKNKVESGYEVQQTSLLYVFVSFLRLDPAQLSIAIILMNLLTNRNIALIYSVMTICEQKAKDCKDANHWKS